MARIFMHLCRCQRPLAASAVASSMPPCSAAACLHGCALPAGCGWALLDSAPLASSWPSGWCRRGTRCVQEGYNCLDGQWGWAAMRAAIAIGAPALAAAGCNCHSFKQCRQSMTPCAPPTQTPPTAGTPTIAGIPSLAAGNCHLSLPLPRRRGLHGGGILHRPQRLL